jgi:ABC-type branched-subunit amino acid transport system ATPase component
MAADPFMLKIPSNSSAIDFEIAVGTSIIVVGANGSGKTRLAAWIERQHPARAHRIAAHRALNLDPRVQKIPETQALNRLRIGLDDPSQGSKDVHRWRQKGATHLLDDFAALIQALFANQTNITKRIYDKISSDVHVDTRNIELTNLKKLKEIFEGLLCSRMLIIEGDDIKVTGSDVPAPYSAADMSDGERAIFYMIGQTLCAAENSLIIFDEPELHVHRSIMAKLWDALEAARPDCAFVLITHDLEFAASRVGQKIVIREYRHPNQWDLEKVPEDTDFPEEIVTRILGSRRPILFVEGDETSLDRAIYRSCYPDWTVIPKGSCDDVIHAVMTMRNHPQLNRITCAGIVDADDRDQTEVSSLANNGIAVLPVSEIENLILLPNVSRTILEHEGYAGTDLTQRLYALSNAIFERVRKPGEVGKVAARHCRRRIDRLLKRINLSTCQNGQQMDQQLRQEISGINAANIESGKIARINNAAANDDLPALLAEYDNKGMLADAATHLKNMRKADFENWLVRVLKNGAVNGLRGALQLHLPHVTPR